MIIDTSIIHNYVEILFDRVIYDLEFDYDNQTTNWLRIRKINQFFYGQFWQS